MVGEAAALHDPLTGNGVTAAFRHAADGTRLILAALERGHLTPRQRRVYDANLRRMGQMFNHGIETAVYDWPLRNGLGLTMSQVVYTVCAFVLNALYTRIRPGGRLSMPAFGALIQIGRIWIDGWTLLGRLAALLLRSRAEPGAASGGVDLREAVSTTRMAYRVAGSGPPVLLLHGMPTSGRLWDLLVERLAPHFTCIVVDLPGLGASPPLPGPPDLDCMAQELEALRRTLALPTWRVVGHDAGAAVVVHYAALHPERVERLALLSAPIFPELRPPWLFRLLRLPVLGRIVAPLAVPALFRVGLPSLLARTTPAAGARAARAEIQAILEDFQRPFRGRAGARRLLWLVRWGDPRAVLGRTAALLPLLTAPTLVVHGSRDKTVPRSFARRAAEAIPGARAVELDGGHFLPLDAPEALGAELAAFLTAPEEANGAEPQGAGVTSGFRTGRSNGA
jgi:pimeloyl-ACP methyl ester carboxylesterase